MKKLLAILLLSFYAYAFSIDPNVMYGLGSVENVPAEDNPVIGLSFLKLGIIKSWLEGSDKDPVVGLTRLLFRLEGASLDAVAIAYLTPEAIGHIVKIMADHQDNLDQVKQAIINYLTMLSEFKSSTDIPEDVDALLDLMVDSLQYVATTTVYPKGGVQSLLLGYLCAISESRDDIQSYFQGYLDDSDFVLPLTQDTTTVTTKAKIGEKKIYKNYFCPVQKSKELDSFIKSFAERSKPYDALQHLVLLFFNFKDGVLTPNRTPSSLMNYIDVAHLGAMMRMIEQYNDAQELVEKLQNYLVGLKIKNRVTGQFLDEESFRPLLIDLSESLNLTEGKNLKYSHSFFESVLHGCVCSRLNSVKDIEDYSKGFFVHATDSLIDGKKKEFACCLSTSLPAGNGNEKNEKEEPWELEFEHEPGHEEGYHIDGDDFDEVADAIVERTVLLDLQKAQAENSVESIVFELVKMREMEEKIKIEGQSFPTQTAQAIPGGFYTMKKRAERQKALQQEAELFAKICKDLKNLPGVVYQRVETKDSSGLGAQALAIAAGFKPGGATAYGSTVYSKVKKTKDSANTGPENQEKISNYLKEKKKPSSKGDDSSQPKPKPKPKPVPRKLETVIAAPKSPAIVSVAGFVSSAGLSLAKDESDKGILLDTKAFSLRVPQSLSLAVVERKDLDVAVIPPSAKVDCVGMQPTLGNLALGLQKVLGLKTIPDQDVHHVMIDYTIAAEYFNRICRQTGMSFDLSQFDPSRPFTVKFGTKKYVINLNMQRNIKAVLDTESSKEEQPRQEVLVAAASMSYQGALIVPPKPENLPQFRISRSENLVGVSENLVASLLLTGFVQAQEIQKDQKLAETLQWMKNIQLLLKAQRALFEFVTLITPKPYERVMSKIDEIMSKQKDLVGYNLQTFFNDPESEYRQGITAQDINQYFEYAPVESIQSLLSEFNKLTERQKYNLFVDSSFSSQALGALFERTPIENLLTLFNDMNPQQKLNILKKIPQEVLKGFINDLSIDDFDVLASGMQAAGLLKELQSLPVSKDQTLRDIFHEALLLHGQQDLKGMREYLTLDDMKGMKNLQEIRELALQRQQDYRKWQARRFTSPDEIASRDLPATGSRPGLSAGLPTRTFVPVTAKRYLNPGSIKHYIAEHGKELAETAVRAAARGAAHGL
jgi:hypothetical protein